MPKYTVIAGPNGSGKSTLIRGLAAKGAPLPNYQNADDIAAQNKGDKNANRNAQIAVRDARDAAIREGLDFSYETVMSHPSHVDDMIRAKNAGHEIYFGFVGTDDPKINVARVAARVALGGHDVPHDKIISRYHNVMNNELSRALKLADVVMVFDNSRDRDVSPHDLNRLLLSCGTGVDEYFAYDADGLSWPQRYLLPVIGAGHWPELKQTVLFER